MRVAPYVLGRFAWDLITMTLQSAVFLGFLYSPVPPIPSSQYFAILLCIAWYTTGLGYLVSMWFSSQNALLAGIAVGLLLGGVANGVQPPQFTLPPYNPLWILNWISFTRWVEGEVAAGSRGGGLLCTGCNKLIIGATEDCSTASGWYTTLPFLWFYLLHSDATPCTPALCLQHGSL